MERCLSRSLLSLPLRELCLTLLRLKCKATQSLYVSSSQVVVFSLRFIINSRLSSLPCASTHLSLSPPLLRPSVPVFFSSLESLLMHEAMGWQVSSRYTKVGLVLNCLWKSFSLWQTHKKLTIYLFEFLRFYVTTHRKSLLKTTYSFIAVVGCLTMFCQSKPPLQLEIIMQEMLYLPFSRLGKTSA